MSNSTQNNMQELTLNERTGLLLEYWKQTSNVQQHFNDVSMKLRNFAVVVFSGFLTGVGLAIHKNISINFLGFDISAGVLFALAGMIATQLIHFMDTYWYHVFLKGAVTTSSSIEKEIKDILKVSELSDGISSSSQQVCVCSLFGRLHFPIGWQSWMKWFFFRQVVVDSTKRHKIFYRWLLVIFIVTGIGSIFTKSADENVAKLNAKGNDVTIVHVTSVPKADILDDSKQVKTTKAGFIISGTNVRVRSLPDFQSEVINLLPVGQQVDIVNFDNQKSWVKISIKQHNAKAMEGWVHRDFIARLK